MGSGAGVCILNPLSFDAIQHEDAFVIEPACRRSLDGVTAVYTGIGFWRNLIAFGWNVIGLIFELPRPGASDEQETKSQKETVA